jgi:hypothetical protein
LAGMTPYDFFDGFVLKNYQDWVDEPYSVRKAFNAAVSAFHLADHYFRYHRRSNAEFSKRYKHIGQFQAALTSQTPSFKVIQDMANAYKHLYTRASCSVASGGSIESLTYGNQTIETDWQEDNGKWTGNIVIRRRDKSVAGFAGAIQEIIEMWSAVLYCNEQPAL